jgi:hypothetical protein
MLKNILKSITYMYVIAAVVYFTLAVLFFPDIFSLYFLYIIVTAGVLGGASEFLLKKETKNDAARK